MRGSDGTDGQQVKQMLERMDLTLNEEKTRVLDARQESFEFLGFSFSREKNFKDGKGDHAGGALTESPKKKFRDEVRSSDQRVEPTVWGKTNCSSELTGMCEDG